MIKKPFGGIIFMNEKLKSAISELLSTSGGNKAKNDLKNMNMSQVESKLSSMNKEAVVKKLYDMKLDSLAQRINGMSEQEIIAMIKANPQFIDMIKKL